MSGEIVKNSSVVQKSFISMSIGNTYLKKICAHPRWWTSSLGALEAVSKTFNFDKCAPKLFVEHCWAVEGQNLISLDVRFIVIFLRVGRR